MPITLKFNWGTVMGRPVGYYFERNGAAVPSADAAREGFTVPSETASQLVLLTESHNTALVQMIGARNQANRN